MFSFSVVDRMREFVSQVLGPRCAKVFLEDWNPTDMPCNQLLLSKMLSLCILLGGLFVKVPQILKVLTNRSSKGLSLLSLVIETSAAMISVAYNQRKEHPFTTFGESLFIMIQNVILVALVLILRYAKVSKTKEGEPAVGAPSILSIFMAFSWIGIFITSIYGMISLPSLETLATLQGWSIGLIIAARVPQIILNAINHSTGKLSFLTTLLMAGGSLARIYTTWQEIRDPQLLITVSIAAFLNMLLLFQFFIYWKQPIRASTRDGLAAQKSTGSLRSSDPKKNE